MPDTANTHSTESMRLTKAKSDRLAWVLKGSEQLLAKAVGEDTSPEARQVEALPHEQMAKHVARLILEHADPTVAKTMTAWLVRQYVQGGLRLEDLGTACETLDAFHLYAPKLPRGKRDLGQYPNLVAVWEAVSPIAEAAQEKLSGKAQKALDRDKAYAESRILRQDPDGFTIAVPLTEFAAKWWGRGTRWCTAAENNNQVWSYHEEAPLIVMVIPELKEKGKFQICIPKDNIQFMDAADSPVSEVLITEYWARFGPVVDFLLQRNGRALAYLPKRLRTDATCRIAVARNGRALEYVPEALRDEEMRRIAVSQNGLALHYVPEVLRTEDMCRIAVAQNGWALGDVPGAHRTEEICSIAVEQIGLALQYVPERLRTEEMCRLAVKQNGWALEYVPAALRTDEICRTAVAQNGGALEYVPWDLRTEDMCRIAVAQRGYAFYHVPEDLRTDEMRRIAVAQYGRALKYVPCKFENEALHKIAVAQNYRALAHVPEAMRDRIGGPEHSPLPAWHLSLLDDLATVLGSPNSPDMSGPPHV